MVSIEQGKIEDQFHRHIHTSVKSVLLKVLKKETRINVQSLGGNTQIGDLRRVYPLKTVKFLNINS